jgi:hypothetical protein
MFDLSAISFRPKKRRETASRRWGSTTGRRGAVGSSKSADVSCCEQTNRKMGETMQG